MKCNFERQRALRELVAKAGALYQEGDSLFVRDLGSISMIASGLLLDAKILFSLALRVEESGGDSAAFKLDSSPAATRMAERSISKFRRATK